MSSRAIDIHAHFLPSTAIAAARAGKQWRGHDLRVGRGDSLTTTRQGRTYTWDNRYWATPSERVALMDRRRIGIEVISLTAPLFGYRLPELQAIALAQEANDEMADFMAAAPTRFRGLATLPMQDSKAAALELERVLGNPSIVGAVVGGLIPGTPWHDAALRPVLDVAAEKRAVLLVHPIPLERDLESFRHGLGSLVGQPLEMTLAWADFAYGGVLDRYPELTVCFAQGGGIVSFLAGRFDRGKRLTDHGEKPSGAPGAYVSRVYYDSLAYSAQSLRLMLDVVGADRVILGSDFPSYLSVSQPVAWLESSDTFTAQEKHAILQGNAMRALGLTTTGSHSAHG